MISLRLCALLLPLLAFAPAQDAPATGPAPDARLQSGLCALVEASGSDERRAALQFVAENAGEQSQRLIPQLLLFTEQSRSTREGMLFGALVEQLRIPQQDLVAGLVPLLEEAGAARRASIGGVLAQFEAHSIDRAANFDHYRPFLAAEAPVGLTRYLYESDPDAALITLTRARVRDAGALRALVHAQHVVADLRWQLRFGYISGTDLPAAAPLAALEALGELATHEAWWARLAAAQLAVEQPGLRSVIPVDALAEDAHATVREVAALAR
jgi:hypothetical protein